MAGTPAATPPGRERGTPSSVVSAAAEAAYSIRIVDADHYMATPLQALDE